MPSLLPKILTITGLCLDIVGVVMLAYDALYGRGRDWWLKTFEIQLQNLEASRDTILDSYRHMDETGSRREYITRLIEETNSNIDGRRSELETKIADLKENHPRLVFIWAKRGLILITLGFALQICGSLFS